MNVLKLSADHLAGQNYFAHLLSAFIVAAKLLTAAVAAFLHALFPFLFGKVTVKIVEGLHAQIEQGRAQAMAQPPRL